MKVGWRSDEEVAIALADTWRNFSAALAFKASNTEIVWLFLLRNGGELNDSTLQALRPALDDNKLVESNI